MGFSGASFLELASRATCAADHKGVTGLVDMREGHLLRAAVAAALLLLAGCAGAPFDPDRGAALNVAQIKDPLEPLNRGIFKVNLEVERFVLKPAARGYRTALPKWGRDRIRGILNNIGEPLILANDILQLRLTAASKTLFRLIVNSTLGLAGMFDVADGEGVPRQTGDFGQTLWVWGFDSGPYFVIPVLGPSNIRDGIGYGVDSYADPAGRYIQHNAGGAMVFGRTAVDGIDLLSRNLENLEQLQREALDYYALMRSVSQQRRLGDLREALGLSPELSLEDPGATP
jgi:phospholipid-binding lipoprotein MlaA